jgi:hypothetical protein
LLKTNTVHSCGEAERRNEGLGTLVGRDGAAHKLGQARKTGKRRRKVGKGRRMKTEEQRGRAVFMVVEESGEATMQAPSRIEGPLNPGRQTPRLRYIESFNINY